jgi:hypothetical protein
MVPVLGRLIAARQLLVTSLITAMMGMTANYPLSHVIHPTTTFRTPHKSAPVLARLLVVGREFLPLDEPHLTLDPLVLETKNDHNASHYALYPSLQH